MSERKILCPKCGADYNLHPDDRRDGFAMRKVRILARKPEHHFITINGVPQGEMASLLCDLCGAPVEDGREAVATTIYRGSAPRPWEHEYGEIIQREETQ